MERRRVERVEALRRHFEPPTVPGRVPDRVLQETHTRGECGAVADRPWPDIRPGSAAWHVLKPRGTVVNVSKPPTEPHDAPDTPSLSDGATADAGRDRRGGGREAVSVADAA